MSDFTFFGSFNHNPVLSVHLLEKTHCEQVVVPNAKTQTLLTLGTRDPKMDRLVSYYEMDYHCHFYYD